MKIGIAGRKRSGKNTVADIISEINPSFKQIAFADKVKECCSCIFNIKLENFYKDCKDTSRKKLGFHELSDGADLLVEWLEMHGVKLNNEQKNWVYSEILTLKDFTLRGILQFIGTDICRNLDNKIWINLLLKEIEEGDWIVTDARYPNERDALREARASLWLVDRETELTDSHESENNLVDIYDVVIHNNSDLPALQRRVEREL